MVASLSRARSCFEAAAFLLDTRHECCDLLLGGCLHSRKESSGASRACQTGSDDRSPPGQQKPTTNMNLKSSRSNYYRDYPLQHLWCRGHARNSVRGRLRCSKVKRPVVLELHLTANRLGAL